MDYVPTCLVSYLKMVRLLSFNITILMILKENQSILKQRSSQDQVKLLCWSETSFPEIGINPLTASTVIFHLSCSTGFNFILKNDFYQKLRFERTNHVKSVNSTIF